MESAMNKRTEHKHESYGMLRIARVHTSGINLFGSSIQHRDIVELEISTGTVERSLSNDWYHDRQQIISVYMSPTQFAEAITTLNVGSGVPVTLHRISGKTMAECPHIGKVEQFNKEFQDDMKDAARFMNSALEKAKELLDGANKTKIREVIKELESVKAQLENTVPFISEQFTEQMDKTMMEAKGSIEAFITGAVVRMGTEAIREHLPSMDIIKIEHKK